MITAPTLIKELKDYIRLWKGEHFADRALVCILEGSDTWQEAFESGTVEQFQKQIRQVGMFEHHGIDMAVWNLIHGSKLFWEVISEHGENCTKKD